MDAKHYIEPAGDDSCSGCEGQLTEATAASIKSQLASNNILNAKIDLNVRVTVPKSENPYSDSDLDLWATVVRPGGSEKLPTILMATPYRRESMIMMVVPLITSRYNVMVIDIRGTGSSSGTWESFDLVEQYDIKYVVDRFIPSRVWSDGTVGMMGQSYMGIIQLLTAGLVEKDPATGEPVHLKAIYPGVPMADTYRDIVMHGGTCDLLFIPMWLGMVDIMSIMPSLLNLGVDGTFTKEDMAQAQAMWLEHLNQIPATVGWIMDASHMNKTDFYEKKSTMIYWPVKPKAGWSFPEGNNNTISSKLPVFEVGGWFDIFTRGTCNYYQYGLSRHAATDKKMIIGEWYHLSGAMAMGLNSVVMGSLPARWFDWKIKKKNDPFMEEYPVLLYIMGENKWRAEKSWPLPDSRLDHRTLYLTKHAPTPIDGDWYTQDTYQIYKNNNYGLSEVQDFTGDNPVLKHDVFSLTQMALNLHGGNSRSSTRWLMGMEAMISDMSKFYLGLNIDSSQWFEDERHDEKECLTFTTEPLDEDMEITGPLTITFWAKTKFSDPLLQWVVNIATTLVKEKYNIDTNLVLDTMNRKDVQWTAEMTDVFPSGRARNVASGWLSAWHRQYDPTGKTSTVVLDGDRVAQHGLDPAYIPFDPFYDNPDKNPKAINEGELYQYCIELWPTSNVFKAGHRIRVSLSGSDFPHLLPVLRPSNNTIVIDADHEARVDFTAVNDANEGATWKWIGSNADADKYLMEGGSSSGCGTSASAASQKGTVAGLIAEIMGLLGIMVLPMSLIMMQRHLRKKNKP
ncbi:MAG: CocE/NonD family hydrolase [Spirochaetes bacterium]|nr:CocE/NonD family hydrolase [Spirochaetota bacterium]